MNKRTSKYRRGILATAIASATFLTVVSPASAATSTQTMPNGCRISASNSYSSNYAYASTAKVSGYPCFTIEVKFTYYDNASGTYKVAGGGYFNSPSVTAGAYTNVQPAMSSHNAHAVAGDTAWGFGLYF